MITAKTPYIVKRLYYSLVWDIKKGEKEIFITFDDGPTPEVTPKVLDILDKYNAKATFFCIGRNVDRYPNIFKKIMNNGHSAGNHTYSHLKGWKTRNKEYYNDIELANQLIHSELFRPPYGKIRWRQFKKLRYKYNIIMWDVMCGDYDMNISKEQCLNNVVNNTRPGSIIIFHDSVKAKENMFYVLPKMLEIFSQKGYVFNALTNDRINKYLQNLEQKRK